MEAAVAAGDKAAAQACLISATSEIDKACTKGVYHKNNASRKVSRLSKAVNMQKTGDKKYKTEAALLGRILAHLESEKPVRTMQFDEDEQALVEDMFLLTSKPVIYAANIAEDDIGQRDNELVKR